MEWVSLLGTSLGLGAGAGLNSYATLLVFGLLARFRPGMFPSDLAEFFASTPVLIAVGVLYSIEFVADKIPAVDHVWDVVHTFVRPIAGGFVAVAAAAPGTPRGAIIVASLLAGSTALTGHVAKASIRAASTATTAGTANPILSVIEDILAVMQALAAVFLPVIMVVVLVIFVLFLLLYIWRRMRRVPAEP